MNIVILKLYITDEINGKYYNSQEMGMAKALIRSFPDHRVDIVVLSGKAKVREDFFVKDEGVDDRICVHVLPGKGIGHHGYLDLKILKELKADLVHLLADNMFFSPNVIDYCQKNRIKCHLYIGTLYSDSSNRIKRGIGRLMFGRNIAAYKKVPVYAKTPFVRKQLQKLGVDAKLAPVGLEPENLIPSKRDISAVREKYGIPSDRKVLLYVGRLQEYKRPLEAVELLEKLSHDDSSKYFLLMIGSGELESALKDRIKAGNLEQLVKLIGRVPNSEMKDIFRACDYFVNFNRVEIYGMAILEAMANSCPVVAMRAPGPEYIIENGRSGFLCSSIGEMKGKIISLCGDDNMRTDIITEARRRVENELTWDKTVLCFDDWSN